MGSDQGGQRWVRSRLRRVSVALALLLVGAAVACGGGGASAPTPTPSRTPKPTPTIDRCAELAKRQITVCPPADLAIPKVPVTDKTNGLLTPQQLRNEAEAVERWFALDNWALDHRGASLLRSSVMVSPGLENLEFSLDLQLLDKADSAGGTLKVATAIQLIRLDAVPLSNSVRQISAGQGLVAGDHGWVYTIHGPGRVLLQVPGKADEVVIDLPSTLVQPILLLGSAHRDPILGWVWVAGGDFNCTNAQQPKVIRDACL